jgi:putative spermidine/putrescine transport system substrate-binding protein
MKLRRIALSLVALAATVALSPASVSPASARDITVAMQDGPADRVVRDALTQFGFGPFAASGGDGVDVVAWPGGLDAFRQNSGAWDLVSLDPADAQAGCDQNLFEKLDWSAIGGRDAYSALGATDCTVGAFAVATVLMWDRDKFLAQPTWADFWDIAKYPGKRGLRKAARGNLEIALMADGVAPRDVYSTLRGADGVARAFRKLDQLKPYLVFWSTGAEAVHILGSGGVLMTSVPDTVVVAANRDDHRNLGLQWAGNLTSVQSWAIPKGSGDVASTLKLLAFLGDPKLEAKLPAAGGVGGLAKAANDGLAPEQQTESPTLQANLDKGLVVDAGFWRDNREKLGKQFDDWLAH